MLFYYIVKKKKVADFGESRHWEQQTHHDAAELRDGIMREKEIQTLTFVGTSVYMAPEILASVR